MVTLNTLVFSVFRTDVPKAGTGHYKYGQREYCKLQIAGENIIHETLMLTNKIIFLPLHITLGLMKQYVKILDKDEHCFRSLCSAFPGFSEENLKAGIFDGSKI